MSKTLGLLLASSLAATSAMPALAGGLDDAIIEAPVVVEPAPAPAGLGGLGTAGRGRRRPSSPSASSRPSSTTTTMTTTMRPAPR